MVTPLDRARATGDNFATFPQIAATPEGLFIWHNRKGYFFAKSDFEAWK